MKKSLLYLWVLLCSLSVTAQTSITVEETTAPMSWGTQPCFQTFIPQVTLKDVEQGWSKYTSTKSKEKTKKEVDEYVQPTAVYPGVSNTTFRVYAKLFETGEGVRLTAWAIGADSAFISTATNGDQAIAFSRYIRDYAVQAYRDAVTAELKTETSALSKLEKNLKSDINKEEKLRSQNKKYERDIEKNKRDIALNKSDQDRKSGQLQTQKRAVESSQTTYGSVSDEMTKTLKTLEKEKLKLEKAHEKLHQQNDKYEKNIRENLRTIEDTKASQREERDNIEKQKAKVKSVEDKLNGIK